MSGFGIMPPNYENDPRRILPSREEKRCSAHLFPGACAMRSHMVNIVKQELTDRKFSLGSAA
jgi:hypothetical protein